MRYSIMLDENTLLKNKADEKHRIGPYHVILCMSNSVLNSNVASPYLFSISGSWTNQCPSGDELDPPSPKKTGSWFVAVDWDKICYFCTATELCV